jgi:hypothetical protein
MRKISLYLLLPLFTFILGMTATWQYIKFSRTHELRVTNPNPRWEQIFFPIINRHVLFADLPDLRTVILPEEDFEVRVWIGFGLEGEEGIILRYEGTNWNGYHLRGIVDRPPHSHSKDRLKAPKSGWEMAWQKLVEAGILTLPDSDRINCNEMAKDGVGYVVEINKNKTYRTYRYSNPQIQKCKEAQQIMTIGDIIADEFELASFKH